MDAWGRGEFRHWHGLKELNYNKPKHGASVWWLGGEENSDNGPAWATPIDERSAKGPTSDAR